jgi:hypothetical protein
LVTGFGNKVLAIDVTPIPRGGEIRSIDKLVRQSGLDALRCRPRGLSEASVSSKCANTNSAKHGNEDKLLHFFAAQWRE